MAQLNRDTWHPDLEKMIRDALKAIRYGSGTLVVQDGLVIQVDTCEKIRLPRQGHINGSGI